MTLAQAFLLRLRAPLFAVTFGTLAANSGIMVVNLISGALTARALGPDGRGAAEAVFLLPLVATPLLQLGIGEAFTLLISRDASLASPASGLLFPLTLIFGVLGVPLAILSNNFLLFQYPDEVKVLALMAAVISVLCGVFCCLALGILNGLGSYHTINVIRVLQPLAELLFFAPLAVLGLLKLETFVMLRLLISIVITIVYLSSIWRLKLARYWWRWDSDLFRIAVRLGVKFQTNSLTSLAGIHGSRIAMVAVLNPTELGIYAVATRIADIAGVAPQALLSFIFPEASRTRSDIRWIFVGRMVRIGLALGIVSALVMFPLLPLLTNFAFGASFVGAVPVAAILLPGVVMSVGARLSGEGLKGLGTPMLTSAGFAAGTLVLCFGLFALTPEYGIIGAASATTFGHIVSLITMTALLRWVRQK